MSERPDCANCGHPFDHHGGDAFGSWCRGACTCEGYEEGAVTRFDVGMVMCPHMKEASKCEDCSKGEGGTVVVTAVTRAAEPRPGEKP